MGSSPGAAPSPPPPPEPLTQADVLQLERLQNGMSDWNKQMYSGSIDPGVHQAGLAVYQQQIAPLAARQQAEQAAAEQKAIQQAMHQNAIQKSLQQQDKVFDAEGFQKAVARYISPITGLVAEFKPTHNGGWEEIGFEHHHKGQDRIHEMAMQSGEQPPAVIAAASPGEDGAGEAKEPTDKDVLQGKDKPGLAEVGFPGGRKDAQGFTLPDKMPARTGGDNVMETNPGAGKPVQSLDEYAAKLSTPDAGVGGANYPPDYLSSLPDKQPQGQQLQTMPQQAPDEQGELLKNQHGEPVLGRDGQPMRYRPGQSPVILNSQGQEIRPKPPAALDPDVPPIAKFRAMAQQALGNRPSDPLGAHHYDERFANLLTHMTTDWNLTRRHEKELNRRSEENLRHEKAMHAAKLEEITAAKKKAAKEEQDLTVKNHLEGITKQEAAIVKEREGWQSKPENRGKPLPDHLDPENQTEEAVKRHTAHWVEAHKLVGVKAPAIDVGGHAGTGGETAEAPEQASLNPMVAARPSRFAVPEEVQRVHASLQNAIAATQAKSWPWVGDQNKDNPLWKEMTDSFAKMSRILGPAAKKSKGLSVGELYRYTQLQKRVHEILKANGTAGAPDLGFKIQ
jgi:hypothetical protein